MEIGDSVAIYKTNECQKGMVGVGSIVDVTTRLYRVKSKRYWLSGSYWRSNLSFTEKGLSIVHVSADQAAFIEKEIERREEADALRRDQEEEQARQAAYDALPEGIKLTRKLKWLCACNREDKIAQIPLELLRGVIQWADSNKLELE